MFHARTGNFCVGCIPGFQMLTASWHPVGTYTMHASLRKDVLVDTTFAHDRSVQLLHTINQKGATPISRHFVTSSPTTNNCSSNTSYLIILMKSSDSVLLLLALIVCLFPAPSHAGEPAHAHASFATHRHFHACLLAFSIVMPVYVRSQSEEHITPHLQENHGLHIRHLDTR